MTDCAIDRYCQEVARQLEIPKRQRRKLLSGLRQDLENRPLSRKPSLPDLYAELGAPAETAEALMESVPADEKAQYRVGKRRKIKWIVAALAVLLAVSIGSHFYTERTQASRTEANVIDNGTFFEEEGDISNAS